MWIPRMSTVRPTLGPGPRGESSTRLAILAKITKASSESPENGQCVTDLDREVYRYQQPGENDQGFETIRHGRVTGFHIPGNDARRVAHEADDQDHARGHPQGLLDPDEVRKVADGRYRIEHKRKVEKVDVHSKALFRVAKRRPATLVEKASKFRRFSSFMVMYPLNRFLARRRVGLRSAPIVDLGVGSWVLAVRY